MGKLKSNPNELAVADGNEKGEMRMKALARRAIQALEKKGLRPQP
jgi:hypothetical protein